MLRSCSWLPWRLLRTVRKCSTIFSSAVALGRTRNKKVRDLVQHASQMTRS